MVALERERVERVKPALHRQRERPALGRIGVDIIKRLKPRRIFRRLAEAQGMGGKSVGGGKAECGEDGGFHKNI